MGPFTADSSLQNGPAQDGRDWIIMSPSNNVVGNACFGEAERMTTSEDPQ
jgi:hypothetical protein